MMMKYEQEERKTHYVNRFRNRSFDDNLEVDQTETKEYQQVDRRIKNLEAELQDARTELYILNKAFDQVSREERVRKNQAALQIADRDIALITEVYERAQKSAKLRGCHVGWKHDLTGAWSEVRNLVENGTYGRRSTSFSLRDEEPKRFHPTHVTYRVLCAACTIMGHDTAAKYQPLSDRVFARRQEIWPEYQKLDNPYV